MKIVPVQCHIENCISKREETGWNKWKLPQFWCIGVIMVSKRKVLFFCEVDREDCPNITFSQLSYWLVIESCFVLEVFQISFLLLHCFVMSSCCRVKLYENHNNHSSIYIALLRLVTYPEAKRLSKKRYEGSKISMDFFFSLEQGSPTKYCIGYDQGLSLCTFYYFHLYIFLSSFCSSFLFYHFVISFPCNHSIP